MKDVGLRRDSFTEITRTLAPDLVKQAYYPTRDPAAADVLIVVHWGSTLVDDNPDRDHMIDLLNASLPAYTASIAAVGHADTGPLNTVSDAFGWSRENSNYSFERNAALLGYARELKKGHADFGLETTRESAIRTELNEERYFVVLMAYDYKTVRKGDKGKLLWVTRLSVRAPGNNFTEALPVLSQAGSHVFGRHVDGLTHLDANIREGVVSVKSLKFLGVTEESGAKVKTQ